MEYFELRVTGVEEMRVVWEEVSKRHITGFGMREDKKRDGTECPIHAHYLIYTSPKTIKHMRDAFRAKGIKGNECYKIAKVRDYDAYCKYTCKQYTPLTVEYQYGWSYNTEFFEEQKALWDAGFDPVKAANKDKKTESLMEILCDGLDSSSSRQMIARNLAMYCRTHFKETKFWNDEKCRALVKQVELQLRGHDPVFLDEVAERWAY